MIPTGEGRRESRGYEPNLFYDTQAKTRSGEKNEQIEIEIERRPVKARVLPPQFPFGLGGKHDKKNAEIKKAGKQKKCLVIKIIQISHELWLFCSLAKRRFALDSAHVGKG